MDNLGYAQTLEFGTQAYYISQERENYFALLWFESIGSRGTKVEPGWWAIFVNGRFSEAQPDREGLDNKVVELFDLGETVLLAEVGIGKYIRLHDWN
jgi:hypothetical protein